MTSLRRRSMPVLAGLAALGVVLGGASVWSDPFVRVRLAVFDALQRASPWAARAADSDAATDHVRVIDIDDQSLERLGQWPWPRTVVAEMVTALQDMDAAAIAFDAVFPEPDRTSPSHLARKWQRVHGVTVATPGGARLPDHDAILADAIARGRVVTGFSLAPGPNGQTAPKASSVGAIGGNPASFLSAYQGAIVNLPSLDAAAAGHGVFTVTAGRDELIRRLPLIYSFQGEVRPSLALEALRVAEGESTIRIRIERAGGPGGPATGMTVRIGRHDIPLRPDGTIWMHHRAAGDVPAIPAWKLLDPEARREIAPAVAGRIMLVGTSAVGLADLRPTPLNPFEPGVNIHATALDQIMAGHHLARPVWLPGVEQWLAAGAAVMVSLIVALSGLVLAALVATVLVLATASAVTLLFTDALVLFDPTLVVLATLTSFIASSLARYIAAERDAGRLRNAFRHYLAPALVEALVREPDQLKLGGETREMTFLFTDLEGFTRLTETSPPDTLVALLNGYLDGLSRIALEHGGTVDKIVGDALHVMFNAPILQPDHASRAVRAALAMDAFGRTFAAEQAARGIAFGRTRIGVNTGMAVVGNFGGSARFDYTAHGDAINTAARLEAANKTLGTAICVSGATRAQVSDVAFLPVGALRLRGKARPVSVFVPLDAGLAAPDWAGGYEAALSGLEAGEERAAATLVALHEKAPDSPLLALHARRIAEGARSIEIAA